MPLFGDVDRHPVGVRRLGDRTAAQGNGQTQTIPYIIKCVSRKPYVDLYSYEFYGG